ncbi:MAG TPA: 2-oxo acid dehydrogenase subunit E2 [Solirubrobacteraceae bacterium]|nr:2-oxo acid dehydrogenase subunit E2 [Solirubrobacteraceae bacterium]
MSEISPSEPGVKGTVTTLELTRQERAVARRSAETRAVVPSVELACRVEMDACLDLARQDGVRPLSLVLAILARALREFPRLNGAYRDGRYELYSRVNLGVGLPGPEEPVNATLFDAAERPVDELDADLADLSSRAGEGRLSAAELSGATFAVTPPGPGGVTFLTPLVQPPQAAALAVGAWLRSPVVREDGLGAGRVSQFTLACDHRIVHAHLAAEFLAHLKRSLEAPAL